MVTVVVKAEADPPRHSSRHRPVPLSVIEFRSPAVRDAWCAAWAMVRENARPDGLGALLARGVDPAARRPATDLLLEPARRQLPALVGSIQVLAMQPAVTAATALIGAGPGLTPSWDDLLIGMMSGMRRSAPDRAHTRFLAGFGQAVLAAAGTTTDVSRNYIRATVQDDGPAWIEAVLAAIAAGDRRRSIGAAAAALRVGHTSGSDMMLGTIIGSALWQYGNDAAQVLSELGCAAPDHGGMTMPARQVCG
jgi:hypothetical protein